MSNNDFNRISFPSVTKTNPRSRFVDEDEEIPEQGTQKEYLRNIIFLIPLAFLLFIFIFICIQLGVNGGFPSDKNGEAAKVMEYLNKNLHTAPIQELRVEKKGEACPLGYKKSVIGHFNGLKSGCLCEDGSLHSKSHCESNKSGQCKYYSGKSKEALHVWKNAVFCEKRYSRWKFVSNSNTCTSEGLFKCQDYICVDDKKCPVTGVKFLGLSETTNQGEEVYTVDNMKVRIERSVSLHPFVGFNNANTLVPCVISDKEPDTKQKVYPLDKVNPKGCGRYENIKHFSSLLDQMKFYDFYTENGIMLNEIPFFKSYYHSDMIAKFYGVRRVPTAHNPECQNIHPEKVKRLDDASSSISTALTVFGVFILLFCIAGIVLSIMFLLRNKIPLKILQKRLIVAVLFGIALVVVFFIFLQAIVFWGQTSHYDLGNTKDHYEKLDQKKCLETQPFKKAGTDVQNLSDDVTNKVGWIVAFLFVVALIFLIILGVIFFLRRKRGLPPLPSP